MTYRLWNFWRSSASHRVRIALNLKTIPYEYVAVRLAKVGGEQQEGPYRDVNPMQQVPCLEWQEDRLTRRITQSVAILEYLEDRHPELPLLPKDAFGRAWVRQLVEAVNSGIQPLQNLPVLREIEALGGDGVAFARGFNRFGLKALDTLAAPHAGAFLYGDSPTLADLFLVPQLAAARRFGAEVDDLSTLLRVEANANALAAFREAHPDVQPDAPKA